VDKVGHLCAWGLKNAYIANPVAGTANSSKIDSTFSFVLQKRTLWHSLNGSLTSICGCGRGAALANTGGFGRCSIESLLVLACTPRSRRRSMLFGSHTRLIKRHRHVWNSTLMDTYPRSAISTQPQEKSSSSWA
jgi:hypothetical protein